MGIADRLKNLTKRAEDSAVEHKEQIHEAVQKAEAAADQQTGGRYHDQIQTAGTKAEALIDNLKPADAQQDQASEVTGEPRPRSRVTTGPPVGSPVAAVPAQVSGWFAGSGAGTPAA